MINKDNLKLWLERYGKGNDLLVVACKDREYHDDERWVVAALSIEDMKDIYTAIGEYLKIVEES